MKVSKDECKKNEFKECKKCEKKEIKPECKIEEKKCKKDKETVVWTDNFSNFAVGNNKPYFYQADPVSGYTCDDGVTTTNISNSELNINSAVFTKSTVGVLDHPKYLIFAKDAFVAPTGSPSEDGKCVPELVFRASIKGKQLHVSPVPNQYRSTSSNDGGVDDPEDDPRVASGALNMVDFNTNIVADFIITNKKIFALYERLPFQWPEFGGSLNHYHAFTHVVPVMNRSANDDYIKLEIAYHRPSNRLRWIINDQEVFRVTRIGYALSTRGSRVLDLGGEPTGVDPVSFSLGFGTFQLPDMTQCNNAAGLSNSALIQLNPVPPFPPNLDPVVQKNPDGSDRLLTFKAPLDTPAMFNYGQGMTISIKAPTVVHREYNGY